MKLFFLLLIVSASSFAGSVPESCRAYQRILTAEMYSVFGPNAPVPVLAAQIQQESACRPDVSSSVGAEGLTQFMPSTAKWLAKKYPKELGPPDPYNPVWAIKAQVRYMRDLVPVPWRTECDWWAAKLSSYNGGEGWLHRDQRVCASQVMAAEDCTPCVVNRWFGNVELTPDTRRTRSNIKQNRDYVNRILLKLSPDYVNAGYGRGVECPY